MDLTLCSCHVTYAFQSETTLYICLKVKELLARNRRNSWSLSDCNGTRTHNHLVRKRTLRTLAKLTKWLSWVVSTYLYDAFDSMFLSCHVHISEWIDALDLPKSLGTLCSKQPRYLKFKWLKRELKLQPPSSQTKTQTFGPTDEMIGLSCEHLSQWCLWLYVLAISRTHFKVNPHSIFTWMSRNSLLEPGEICEVEVTTTRHEPTTT